MHSDLHRRTFLRSGLLAGAGGLDPVLALAQANAAPPARPLTFPRDHGSHPGFNNEWWRISGTLQTADGAGARRFGFLLAFFRSRPRGGAADTARGPQWMAHAAITDLQGRQMLHDQRLQQQGNGDANAPTADPTLRVSDWRLVRDGQGYFAHFASTGFNLDLNLTTTQGPLQQDGKAPPPKGTRQAGAGDGYSQPQLAVKGRLMLDNSLESGVKAPPVLVVSGTAWLDHEWSQAQHTAHAVGLDRITMNLFDGSALTAFQLRDRHGKPVRDGGVFRAADGRRFGFSPGEVVFSRQKSWKSPASQASYPVEWIVRTPADFFTVRAVIPNQELDGRATTGSLYWEGLSELFDSNGKLVGRGYLEMTGYARPLRL